MPENVAQALDMSHLREEKERVDREFAAALNLEADSPKDEFPAELCQEEYTFALDFAAPNGKRYQGQFTNRVLTVGQKIKVDIIRARRMVGATREAMTDSIVGMILMVSWLEESLTARPKWANDLLSVHDEEVIEAIFNHTAEHERCFHRRKKNFDEGES